MTAVLISSVPTRHSSGLLFRYPLFLLGKFQDCYLDILCSNLTLLRTTILMSSVSTRLSPRLLFRYPLFLLGNNQDCYLDILCFYLTPIGTVIQTSSVFTLPKTKIAIKISFISTWKISRLLFRYPLFLPISH